jgi:hypothetical protein
VDGGEHAGIMRRSVAGMASDGREAAPFVALAVVSPRGTNRVVTRTSRECQRDVRVCGIGPDPALGMPMNISNIERDACRAHASTSCALPGA